jgi:hypothetical protein
MIMNKEMDYSEAIYLIQPKEYIDKKQNIYKIGMTRRYVNDRLAQYEKGSNPIFTRNVDNAREVEKILLKEFNAKFKCVKGREYFEGNCSEMIDIINDKIKDYISNNMNNSINNITNDITNCITISEDKHKEEVREIEEPENNTDTEEAKKEAMKNGSYECYTCGKYFGNVTKLKVHIASDTACVKILNKNIKCCYCDKTYTTKRAKDYHETHNCKKKTEQITLKKLEEELKKQIEESKTILQKLKEPKKPGRPKKKNKKKK